MKILIICTTFPPYTSIAARRPYMFAKYLSSFGHSVTVICSGLKNAVVDNSYNEANNSFRVIKYLDESAQSTDNIKQINKKKERIKLMPDFFVNFCFFLYEPFALYKRHKGYKYDFNRIKLVLDSIKDERYDVIFSTFSELSNVYAGDYARKLFNCKWILDFRDRIYQPSNNSWLWNLLYKSTEKKYIERADMVTSVSEDLFYGSSYPKEKIVTIYNGYDSENFVDTLHAKSNGLSFCYTGAVYGARGEALKSFFMAVNNLKEKKQIDLNDLQFNYAGKDGTEVARLAALYGLKDIVKLHGFIQPREAEELQKKADVFVVLSWNFTNNRGILTGKFYDGIKAGNPILCLLTGTVPNSELYRLNIKYRYGFCYEQSRKKEDYSDFESYLLDCYHQKQENGQLSYTMDKNFVNKFNYENLTRELELLCIKIANNG